MDVRGRMHGWMDDCSELVVRGKNEYKGWWLEVSMKGS